MILPNGVGRDGHAQEIPESPDCQILDKYWEELGHGSIPDPWVWLSDRGFPDSTIAGDLDFLKVLHQFREGAGDDLSSLATIALSRAAGSGAGPGPDSGPRDPGAGPAGANDRDRERRKDPGAGSPGPVPGLATHPSPVPVPVPDGDEAHGDAAGETPRQIGKYLVVDLLDAGGQAQVFRVVHPELAKEMVLKLGLRPIAAQATTGTGGEPAPGSTARAALLREGRLLAQLDHPNLVRVVDVGVHGCRPYIVMEYVPGLTLQQYALQRRPGPVEAARLVAELAGAVAYLHSRGIVHQDIKPRNVLVDGQGRPRLIDFGLSRWDHAWSGAPGDCLGGTANYMSPEQALGQPDRIGPWTDVFGLGGLLYHLLTLGPPYRGASSVSVLRQAREVDYLPIRRLAPATPRGLARIAQRALAADPERRFHTAAELETALRRFLARRRIVAPLLAMGLVLSALAIARIVPARTGPAQPADPAAPASASSSPLARGPGAPAPPRILGLRVESFRGEPSIPMGQIGVSTRAAQVDDEVQVSARFDAPVHGYLIALDPDGQVQLCQPLEASQPPPRSEEIRIDESKSYALTGRPGLQAFVVIASRQALPPYQAWPGSEGLRRRWKPDTADQAWRFDGRRFEPISPVSRGGLKDRPRPEAPATFREVAEYLAKRPEIEAIEAVAFPVKPKG